jgi:hypothetical protein
MRFFIVPLLCSATFAAVARADTPSRSLNWCVTIVRAGGLFGIDGEMIRVCSDHSASVTPHIKKGKCSFTMKDEDFQQVAAVIDASQPERWGASYMSACEECRRAHPGVKTSVSLSFHAGSEEKPTLKYVTRFGFDYELLPSDLRAIATVLGSLTYADLAGIGTKYLRECRVQ